MKCGLERHISYNLDQKVNQLDIVYNKWFGCCNDRTLWHRWLQNTFHPIYHYRRSEDKLLEVKLVQLSWSLLDILQFWFLWKKICWDYFNGKIKVCEVFKHSFNLMIYFLSLFFSDYIDIDSFLISIFLGVKKLK